MARPIPMQPVITLMGDSTSASDIIQPVVGWLDAAQYKEATIDMLMLQNTASCGNATVILETSIATEGPWTSIASFGAGYCKTIKYFTSNEGGTDQFERFIRWRIDRTHAALSNWETCFRICAVVK